jgi:cell division protein FtsB
MIRATGKTRALSIITLLLLVAMALVFSNVFPFRQIIAQQDLVEQKEQTLAVLEEENARLNATAEYLQTDQGVEKIARQDFGYVREGEVAYVVVAPPEQQVEFTPPPPEPLEELDTSWWQGVWDFLTGRDLLG